MSKTLEIIYENGVLRPLGPVPLRENERATVVFQDHPELPDQEFMDACGPGDSEDVSLETVRKALSRIPGSMTTDFIAEREDR